MDGALCVCDWVLWMVLCVCVTGCYGWCSVCVMDVMDGALFVCDWMLWMVLSVCVMDVMDGALCV